MTETAVTAVVPTLGVSPLLGECLASLRAQQPAPEIVVVCPRRDLLPGELAADRVVETGRAAGFAAATNAGWRAAPRAWLATVNDDVTLAPGWLSALLDAAASRPEVAALQGVNVMLRDAALVDGCGLAWNPWLQAVQIGHGGPPPRDAAPREIFGVSATAALYRRRALDDARLLGGGPFDPRFGSYYEDVDLAVRLRAAGHRALLVPAASARHAGGATGGRRPLRHARLVYGNRLLALRRALGRGLWRELPLLAARDAVDAWRCVRRGELAAAAGVACGWGRALWRAGGLEPVSARFGSAAQLRAWTP